ncbi:MAG: UDP-N-acetylmuramate dehydrogenase [bacterium]
MMKIKKDVLLSEYTTFKIGGPAKYFCDAKERKNILEAFYWAKENKEKVFVLGGGSNVLFSDKGFDGLVIKIELRDIEVKGNIIYAGAGAKISMLIDSCFKNSLEGLEWAAGIPGITLGGAIRGNAGAFRKCIGDHVKSVEVFDNCKIKKLDREECNFDYRTSLFKEKRDYIILSAELEMEQGDKKIIEEKIKKTAQMRNEKQPLEYPNAGCIFKNVNLRELENELTRTDAFPDEFRKAGVAPVGWLIERCGLKGKRIGKAMISAKHANIIVNFGNAKAKDVLDLMELAEREVKNNFGIELEREIEVIF